MSGPRELPADWSWAPERVAIGPATAVWIEGGRLVVDSDEDDGVPLDVVRALLELDE